MSDSSNPITPSQTDDLNNVADEITFAEFLENLPPNQERRVSDLAIYDENFKSTQSYVNYPELRLYCDDTVCGGPRAFRCVLPVIDGLTAKTPINGRESKNLFLEYLCVNCQRSIKFYAVVAVAAPVENWGVVRKIGEYPPYGPPTPSGMIKLIGPDRDLFLKGRQCETQGLGIGAFGYYRRVVENQKSRILGKIADAAIRLGSSNEIIDIIKKAQNEIQFTKAVEMVKDAIPVSLMIRGHNPLTLLHSALSEGLHDRNDELCLEAAHDIRVVLAELSERIAQALKEEKELNESLSRLINRKPKK